MVIYATISVSSHPPGRLFPPYVYRNTANLAHYPTPDANQINIPLNKSILPHVYVCVGPPIFDLMAKMGTISNPPAIRISEKSSPTHIYFIYCAEAHSAISHFYANICAISEP